MVTPQKIRLSRRVELVPQVGHGSGLVDLAFAPERSIFAALDRGPTVHVWSVEPSEVLLISALPPGTWDRVRWLTGDRLAVRAAETDGAEPVWWVRETRRRDAWRPGGTIAELGGDGEAGGTRWVRADDDDAVLLAHGDRRVRFAGVTEVERAAVDPLTRYVVIADGADAVVCDAETGATLRRYEGEATVVGVAVDGDGARVWVCDAAGFVRTGDPMRDDSLRPLAEVAEATTMALDRSGTRLAVGDASGQLTLLDAQGGRRLVKTPKQVRSFDWEIALCEQAGYVGARHESFGAWLDPEASVLTVRPLPGRATAVCAGLRYPQLVVAQEDGRLLEIELATESLHELARTPFALDHLAVGELGAIGVGAEGLWWFDGDRGTVHEVDGDATTVCAVAMERGGGAGAIAWEDRAVVVDERGTVTQTIEGVSGIRSLAFVRHKSRRSLALVDRNRVLWRYEFKREALTRVGVVETSGRSEETLTQIGALAVDADGTLRALAVGENGHRCLLIVDAATSEAQVLTRVVTFGHQVVAVRDDDGSRLRMDEERSVRMVHDLTAYETHDWLRRPEPGYA